MFLLWYFVSKQNIFDIFYVVLNLFLCHVQIELKCWIKFSLWVVNNRILIQTDVNCKIWHFIVWILKKCFSFFPLPRYAMIHGIILFKWKNYELRVSTKHSDHPPLAKYYKNVFRARPSYWWIIGIIILTNFRVRYLLLWPKQTFSESLNECDSN